MFHRQVHATYGRVADWRQKVDADSREGLGENGVLLTCDRLSMAEIGTPVNGRRPFELQAIGNTLVEGRTFTARANRISYVQAKDLLVLEGDGQNDAQLWRQAHVGGSASHAAARKILYWRGTNSVEVDDARFLDLTDMGGQR